MADQDLSALQSNFETLYEEETRLLRQISAEESLQIWVELQKHLKASCSKPLDYLRASAMRI